MTEKPTDGEILRFYREQRYKLGIKESVAAVAKQFAMDSKDVCVALGLDPRRYA